MDLELAKLRYESHGFFHLPQMLDAAIIGRLRVAFDRTAAAYQETWKNEIVLGHADPRFCDIPNIMDCDDAFVDVIDQPKMIPLLLKLVGQDVQLNHTHARLFPPGKTFTAAWHSDLADLIGIDLPQSPNFFMKIHYFFEDLRPDQGCLAFIPGSHRFPQSLPRPQIDDPHHSPLVQIVVPKAGDVVIFNTHVLHMALDNDSPLVRKSLIYAYSHFWVKHYANSVPTNLEKYATTRLRRQLFGVEEEGVSYFDRRYEQNTGGMMTSFRSASKRLMKRVLRATSRTWKK